MFGDNGILDRFFTALSNVFHSIGPIDVLDIALLTCLIYAILKFVRETRAGQLLKGILILVGVYLLSGLIKMRVIHLISGKALSVGLIAIIVLFQPELRRVLEKFGSTTSRLSRLTFGEDEDVIAQWTRAIPIISESVSQLSRTATGALIVIERASRLGEQISNGTVMKAEPSVELFGNIFYNKTPLHDGAVIMRDGIIWAAACFLPKPQKEELIDKHLGSRHRAAIGMSENSDALVIVVSEETGQISVAKDGILTRNYSKATLEKLLRDVLIPQDKDTLRGKTIKLPFRKKTASAEPESQDAAKKQPAAAKKEG
ncbi:MAG: diadenylate cyclase CdaA [Oscillospiraceae bacterium]|nr:diadenylate cyclase CdaA [Oscillospiraceae bacterium]MBR5723098.1 diadenylate cyclase CdaA [Oscillospiraceae bacterium]